MRAGPAEWECIRRGMQNEYSGEGRGTREEARRRGKREEVAPPRGRHLFPPPLPSPYSPYGVVGATGVASPPPVTGARGSAAGASPQVSLLGFQSGTVGSGQSRTPVTGPFTGSTASYRSPRDQTSTGRLTSTVEPSAKARRSRTGNGMDVFRARGMVA